MQQLSGLLSVLYHVMDLLAVGTKEVERSLLVRIQLDNMIQLRKGQHSAVCNYSLSVEWCGGAVCR